MKTFDEIIDEYFDTVEEFIERKTKIEAINNYSMALILNSSTTAKKLVELSILLERAAQKGELSEEQKQMILSIRTLHNIALIENECFIICCEKTEVLKTTEKDIEKRMRDYLE